MGINTKNADAIEPCRKKVDEIIQYFAQKFNVRPVTSEHPKYMMLYKNTTLSTLYSVNNTDHQYNVEDMNFDAYELAYDSKSHKYYDKCSDVLIIDNEQIITPIYVAFERKTEYIYSTCDILLKELIVYQGVTLDDINNESPQYLTYRQFRDYLANDKI